jgi:hypothetical protein
MSPSRALSTLTLLAAACLPGNPTDPTEGGSTSTASTADPTEAPPAGGLLNCDGACTLVIVSQTLDDRVDVYDVGAGTLRGRIALDLKADATGLQIDGNLLDEPYELALTADGLLVTVGHYPDTDQGSLLRFPRDLFADLPPGGTFTVDRYFEAGSFTGVDALVHGRREGIFLRPHPSGRLLVGVFANDLKTTSWTTPSELLVIDPADFRAEAVGSFDLGGVATPCLGGWRLELLDDTHVAVACDGSESVAVATLPSDFATAAPADAAAGITACGLKLGAGDWTTQFVAGDGAGGFLAVQSQLAQAPQLWHVDAGCAPSGLPAKDPPPADLAGVKLLRQPVLVRPASEGTPMWLVAAGGSAPAVVLVRGGASPTLCGAVTGLDLLAADNAPWALAFDASREHLALGAGRPSMPESSEGRGQVLWATLDRASLDACELAAGDVVDLNAGLFAAADPSTWVRAPNVVEVVELGGGA